MPFPGAGRIAKRFGITLACVLAARGCANEIERRLREPPAYATHVTPERIARELTPFRAAIPDYDTRLLERVLAEELYAP